MSEAIDRRHRSRVVRPEEEVAVAQILGATPAQAQTVVDLLAGRAQLTHGVAVVVAAASVRWGVEMGEAVTALAEGKALHGVFSDYELRFGREEAESDLDDAWQRVTSLSKTPWAILKEIAEAVTQRDVLPHGLDSTGDVDASDFHLDVAGLAGFR